MTRRTTQCPGKVDLPVVVSSTGKAVRCPIYVGTCGYSYAEWVDSGFYPGGTKNSDMMSLYGQKFSVVELNYTWYQMARGDVLSRMVAKAPDHLFFAAKLTRTMTHERTKDWQAQVHQYRQGIIQLKNRLIAVLVQLPPDFDRSINNRKYLSMLLDGLHELPVAVEFRHRSWAVDSVFTELERRKVTLVSVDEPKLPDLFPCLDVVTNPSLFYARFHGRNHAGWRSGSMQKKFNYDYSADELSAWSQDYLIPMASCADKGVVFFNNHVKAQAPSNGLKLLDILGGKIKEDSQVNDNHG